MIVNSMTKRKEIDEYVNLIKLEPLKSVKPVQLIFSSIKTGATSFKDLTENERRDLLMMRDDFKETMRTYRKKSEALKALNLHILTTVDRFNLIYLINESIVFAKLSALKKRLASTNRIREMKIIRRYRDLQRASKHQQLNH
jgi:predicted GTPase